jgi:cullin 3
LQQTYRILPRHTIHFRARKGSAPCLAGADRHLPAAVVMSNRRSSARFVISPFQHSVQADPAYARRTWAELQNAISKINERKTSELSFEMLYRYSYNMVLHKHGDILYVGLTDILTAHLKSVAASVSAADASAFLTQLQSQWAWFKVSLNHIRDILMYMDRSYVMTRRKKPVHDLGVGLFRDHVVRDNLIAPRLIDTVLDLIDRERNGEAVDALLLRAVTRMLAELGDDTDTNSVYVNVFENAFLERTRQFYAREAQFYHTEANCADYLRKAEQRMREEEVRVESYLDPQTGEKVRRVAEKELISKYMTVLVEMENSGLIWMLRNDNCDDLRLMFLLFRNIPDGEEELRTHLKNEVLERGTALVSDAENAGNPVALVSSILALKEKYDRILRVAFAVPAMTYSLPQPTRLHADMPGSADLNTLSSSVRLEPGAPEQIALPMSTDQLTTDSGDRSDTGVSGNFKTSAQHTSPLVPDKKFVTAVNEAFERFVNSFARGPEFISLYVDKLLRQDVKGASDDEVELKLDTVMNLFRFLHEKDAFERYYKQHLSKRLLSNRTSSDDAEQSFISKLKNECGYLYTSKMETMFTDMRTSAETTEAFIAQVSDPETELGRIDLNLCVLTTISWPVAGVSTCNVPSAIASCYASFEKYYYSKHEGRRLSWQAQLANADLKAHFGNGTHTVDLSVSAYSMCILMMFNEADELNYDQILKETAIPDAELSRNLQSLAMGKHRILLKEPKTKEIKRDDVFHFNDDFIPRHRRLKIQMVTAQVESEAEVLETRTRINECRDPIIDSAIVRIMKSRKVLEHQQLIAEVTAQLAARFEPNPQDIKKRIENLVNREFLERKPDMRSTYSYVA